MSQHKCLIVVDRPQKETGEGAILRLSLVIAIVFHLLVIGLLSLIPSWSANGVNIETISVFDTSTAALQIQPIDIVSVAEISRVKTTPTQDTVIITPPPQKQLRDQKPPVSNRIPETSLIPAGGGGSKSNVNHKEPKILPTENIGDGSPRPAPTTETIELGGGGGGPGVAIRNTPETPTNPELPLVSVGATPSGEIPGEGTGAGSGSGTGIGTGSGSGIGSESGDGEMPGEGGGTGEGAGTSDAGEGSGDGGFVSRRADRSVPKVIQKGKLTYPASAVEEGAEGTVDLKVMVDKEGRVSQIEILASSGDKRLDGAAKDWIKEWRYLPAVQDGRPRAVWTRATVSFRLE